MKINKDNLILYREKTKTYKNIDGPLLPLLHLAQEMFGYVSKEVHQIIHEEFNIALADINSVVTFYELYHTKPVGKHKISVCVGTTCQMKGSNKIIKEIENILEIKEWETTNDLLFTLIPTKCLGKCDTAPNIMIDNDVYEKIDKKNLLNILKQYK